MVTMVNSVTCHRKHRTDPIHNIYYQNFHSKGESWKVTIHFARMELGIIPLNEMIELAQLSWFGLIVRVRDERYATIAWQARILGRRPKGRYWQTWEEGMH